ncbi:MAG: hypothetical protein HYV03_03100 [Deltaproteobacteria bacterium]|nr:hypothetical protein [Deltaproteobacteria bacterium]
MATHYMERRCEWQSLWVDGLQGVRMWRMASVGIAMVTAIGLSGSNGIAAGRGESTQGAAGVVQAWTAALQQGDRGRLQQIMAQGAGYHRLDLVGPGKLKRWDRGAAPARFTQPAEASVLKVRTLPDGTVVGIVSQIVEEGTVREWESWLSLRPGGPMGWQITHVTDIAMEGDYPGDPEGCPETSAKRHETATLYGREITVRVFQTQRNTDTRTFASVDEKKCAPKPGLALEDLEVAVQESSGVLRGYQHFGRVDRTAGGNGRGIVLYGGTEGGSLTAGGVRLYGLPGGQEYLFLSRSWLRERSAAEFGAVHRVDAYRFEKGSFRKVWGFDFGKEGGEKILWTLAAPTPDGIVRADLTAAGNRSCSGSLQFTWAGSAFKMQKAGVKGGCLGNWWPGGEGSVLSMGEVNLEKIANKAATQETEE